DAARDEQREQERTARHERCSQQPKIHQYIPPPKDDFGALVRPLKGRPANNRKKRKEKNCYRISRL
ncbi:MAG: hypothetical protein PUE41_07675, partial [bacterium]|nr:hypothetical protein [bacterium]